MRSMLSRWQATDAADLVTLSSAPGSVQSSRERGGFLTCLFAYAASNNAERRPKAARATHSSREL